MTIHRKMKMSFDRHPYLKHSTAMPAHKDTQHPAGQVLPTVAELKGQQDLSDYIRSINRAQAFDDVAQEKKLTMDEALSQLYVEHYGWQTTDQPSIGDDYEMHKLIWNAALKHGRL